MNKNLNLLPLGGCGEIGMNMTVLQVEDRYFFIDGGGLFPDLSLPGVELIVPGTAFLKKNGIRPQAWLITHGHEDHIGALPFLYPEFPAPIYSTEFTLELIKAKFKDAGIQKAQFRSWTPMNYKVVAGIKVTPYIVNHSIPESTGLFIETPHGNILHSGDFRIDFQPPEKTLTNENMRRFIGKKPVKIMLADSTNSFSQGTDTSEADLQTSFDSLMATTTGAVVVTAFASNIWRLQTVWQSALKHGRKIYLLGRSLHRNTEIATRMKVIPFDSEHFVTDEQLRNFPKSKLCVVCTGSQGEGFSGASRLAFNQLSGFHLDALDCFVFSARPIPGNEKSINLLMNQIARTGTRIVTSKELNVHVSGHGFAEDLKTCIRTVQPECFMPVHGEFRHLKRHRELAIECGIPPEKAFLVENGDICALSPSPNGVIERVESGRDYVYQGGHFYQNTDLVNTRLSLAKSGIMFVSFILREKGWTLALPPAVANRGVPVDAERFATVLPKIFNQALQKSRSRSDFKENHLVEELRVTVRQTLEERIRYKCMVVVVLQRLQKST